jgi:PAS domain S-box-containing protein
MAEESKRRKNKEVAGSTQQSPSNGDELSMDSAAQDPEVLMRVLVESVIDYAIFLLDRQGRVLTWNRGAERIKGYKANEIIGRHFSTFYTPEDIANNHPTEVLAAALREGHYEEENWRVRKDGSLFLADVVITALYDEKGKHIGFAKITRDITERVRAEENRLHRAQEIVSRTFMRDILFSVTEGRLRFCDSPNDLPEKLHPFGNSIPVTKESLCAIRTAVLGAAKQCSLPQERSQDLLTGVSEAAMNAEVHANGARCEIYTGGAGKLATVQAWICDTGTGIDLSQLHRATLERGFTTQGGLGHGFWLMLNTCDRIWLLTGSEGTTVVLEQDGQMAEPEWMGSRSYAGVQSSA